MNIRILIVLVLVFAVFKAQAQVPPPVILNPNQEITFTGNAGDEVECDGKKFNSQNFSVQVTEEPCNCDGGFTFKIYLDGIVAKSCKSEPKIKVNKNFDFINLPMIDHLTDKEVITLFRNDQVGTCRYNGDQVMVVKNSYENGPGLNGLWDAYLKQNAIDLNADKKSEKVIAKSLRDIVKDKLCGTYSDELIKKNIKDQNRILGSSDLAFEYFVSLGTSADDMIDMGYPVAKLRKQFNLKAEDFKRHGITPWYMRAGGFTVAELKDARYSLSEIMNGGYDVGRDVKPNYSAAEFKAIGTTPWYMRSYGFTVPELKTGGYPLSEIMNGGFDVNRDIKPNYKAADFKSIGTTAWYMRSYGFTVPELKAGGYALSDIMNGGFNIQDVRREYTASDFKNLGTTAWYMRSYGYSASDLKNGGYSLSEIMNGGFDVSRDVKPLFSAQDFKSIGTTAWYMRSYGFTARDLKNVYSLSDIMNGGFNVQSDIKPYFSPSEFRSIGTTAWYMRSYGFTARELFNSGYSKDDLRNGGYSNAEIDSL